MIYEKRYRQVTSDSGCRVSFGDGKKLYSIVNIDGMRILNAAEVDDIITKVKV